MAHTATLAAAVAPALPTAETFGPYWRTKRDTGEGLMQLLHEVAMPLTDADLYEHRNMRAAKCGSRRTSTRGGNRG
jgi:hypothetical protein